MNNELACKAYGIKPICPFSNLEYFDVYNSMSQNIMHVYLEGIFPHVIILVF